MISHHESLVTAMQRSFKAVAVTLKCLCITTVQSCWSCAVNIFQSILKKKQKTYHSQYKSLTDNCMPVAIIIIFHLFLIVCYCLKFRFFRTESNFSRISDSLSEIYIFKNLATHPLSHKTHEQINESSNFSWHCNYI